MRLAPLLLSCLLPLAVATADDAKPAAAKTHPTLAVTTLDGTPWTLAAQRGTWVVVNFWATWCKPCIKEIPDLTALDAKRADLTVIGLAYEEIEKPDLLAFLDKHPAGYPIATVDVYAPPADFETPRGLPMTYLITPDGAVARQFLGPVTAVDLERAIAEHAAAPAPAKAD